MDESAFKNIVRGAQNFSNYAAVDDESLQSFFLVLDTDENGLIDSLEFLSVIALISGISANTLYILQESAWWY